MKTWSSTYSRAHDTFRRTSKKQFLILLVVALSVAAIGQYFYNQSHAATALVAVEVENGTATSPATVVTDTTSSGGKAIKFGAAVTPTPTPPPSTSKPLIGMYNGNPGTSPDEGYKTSLGSYPEIASSYYTTQAVSTTYEKARVSHGTTAFLDLDTKNTAGLIGEIANKSTTGMTYINNFLTSAESVASSAPSGTGVYVSLVHEWEVKTDQNVLTNANDTNAATYAKALGVFYAQAKAIAPHAKTDYWVGGYDTALIAQTMAAMPTAPDAVSYDPYVTKSASVVTAVSKWSAGATFFKGNTSYKAWGSPPLFISETGIDTSHGDASCASFYTNIRTSLRSVGLSGMIHFNSDKTDNNGAVVAYNILNGKTPSCISAFKASIAQQ